MSRPVYLSLFWYGSTRQICSEHRSLKAAAKEAARCERRGGAKHFFWKVVRVRPTISLDNPLGEE